MRFTSYLLLLNAILIGCTSMRANAINNVVGTIGVGAIIGATAWCATRLVTSGEFADIEEFLANECNANNFVADNDGYVNVSNYIGGQLKHFDEINTQDFQQRLGSLSGASRNLLLQSIERDRLKIKAWLRRLNNYTDLGLWIKQKGLVKVVDLTLSLEQFIEELCKHPRYFTATMVERVNGFMDGPTIYHWPAKMAKSIIFMPKDRLINPRNLVYRWFIKDTSYQWIFDRYYPHKVFAWRFAPRYVAATRLYCELMQRLTLLSASESYIMKMPASGPGGKSPLIIVC